MSDPQAFRVLSDTSIVPNNNFFNWWYYGDGALHLAETAASTSPLSEYSNAGLLDGFDHDAYVFDIGEPGFHRIYLLPDLAVFNGLLFMETQTYFEREVLEIVLRPDIQSGDLYYDLYYPRDPTNDIKTDDLAVQLAADRGWSFTEGTISFGELGFHVDYAPGATDSMGIVHTGRFVVVVTGTAFDWSEYGVQTSQSDAGRYLVSLDASTGLRAQTWGTGWINEVGAGSNPVTPGQFNGIDPSAVDFEPPLELETLPVPEHPQELVSPDIGYAGNGDTLSFTEEQQQAIKDVSADFATNMVAGVGSYVVKKVAFAALAAAFPGAGWVTAVKTSVDVYTVTKPLIDVGLQHYLYQLGVGTSEPTSAQINQAFFQSFSNVALKIGAVSDGSLTGAATEIVTKAGIKTVGSVLFRETNSFTYSFFLEDPDGAPGVDMTGGPGRDLGIGSFQADRFDGLAGDDSFFGVGGDDWVTGGPGNDKLDGGDGFDTAVFMGSRSAYSIVRDPAGVTVVGPDGSDKLTGFERLKFDDGFVLLKLADADFDGDGSSDILWRSGGGGQNTIWKSGSSASVQAVTNVADAGWKMVGTGDFNQDGQADILWRNTVNGLNSVWRSGSSANAQGLTTLADPNWVVVGVGDFNADGTSDILWRNSATGVNSIWRGGNNLTAQAVATVADPTWKIVGVGDFDADGTSDILWRNATSGINTIWKGGNNTTTIGVATLIDANWKVAGVGDFNGDGRADILWRNGASGVNSIWRSGNNTDVQAVATIADPNWKVAGTGDYDGNGSSDILWRNSVSGLNVVWKGASNTQAMGLTTQDAAWGVAPYQADAAPARITHNDFNGDGKSDMLWRNTATGLQAIWMSANNATAQGLVTLADQNWKVSGIGDFDGDRMADILWRNTTTGINTVWKSGSNTNTLGITTVADQAWKIAGVGDFNNDGKADIVWRNATTGLNSIWHSGNSATSVGVATVADQAWQIVGIGDFNGDKMADILWRNGTTGVNTIWRSGNSANGQSVATVADQNWKVAGVGDFNNDGISDILWRNAATGVNTIWKGGNNATTQAVTTLADMNWQVVGTGDYNGDGSADILWRNSSTGVNAIWKSGNNTTTQAVTALADLNWSVVDGVESGDLLQGGSGANTLHGTVRSDVLTGGLGNDTMTGGPGADLFRYLASNQGVDSITDFQPGVDKIQVLGSGFGGLPAGPLAAGKFVSAAAPVANQNAQFLYSTATGMLAFDADGAGGLAPVNLVMLVGQPALGAADLMVTGA